MSPQAEDSEDPLIHILEIAGNAIIGGMEKYVYNIAQHLPAKQFNITCITPYESAFTASLRHLGCEVYTTPMDDDPPWRSIQFVTELIRHQKVDLIHAHLPRAHVLAGLAGRLTGIPVVATVHGMDITAQDLGISMTTGSHLTVVCQAAYSQALALGMPPERLTLIPNGVDIKTFSPNRTGAAFRKSLRIPSNVPLVGFVGRMAWEKGPDQFFRMAEHVHKRHPDALFVLVGEGPMEAELDEMIKSANLQDIIRLAGVWTNVWEVYPAFDVLAQTSRVEGMPFVLLEAMACGRPVVAMAVGGVAEIIEVGSTGFVSANGDWAGLADALIKLLAKPEQSKQMGQSARRRVEELYDLRSSIRLLVNLFCRLVGRPVPAEEILHPNWPVARQEQEAAVLNPNAAFPQDR